MQANHSQAGKMALKASVQSAGQNRECYALVIYILRQVYILYSNNYVLVLDRNSSRSLKGLRFFNFTAKPNLSLKYIFFVYNLFNSADFTLINSNPLIKS